MMPAAFIALALLGAAPPLSVPCDEGELQLRSDFEGARAADCRRTEAGFAVTISPEKEPVNKSPWYAFDLIAADAQPVTVKLNYTYGWHRYSPKAWHGEGGWEVLPEDAVETADDGQRAVMSIALAEGRTRIAAQPLYDASERMGWVEALAAASPDLKLTIAGHSVEERPIQRLSSGPEGEGRPLLLLLGSQHPPEVPGWTAMQAFLERLVEDDRLAQEFRDQIRIEIFPILNPDGLDRGHWRLNAALVDINRDWGPFTQPETRIVRDVIEARRTAGDRPVLMVDFHATRKGDILYTPDETAQLTPGGYTNEWASAIESRLDEPSFRIVTAHNPGLPTSKGWFAETYGAPGVTLEIGDETDPDRSSRLGRAAAEAMMVTLLEQLSIQTGTSQEDE